LNVIDESLDIYRSGAALLARSVLALETPIGFPDGLLDGHEGRVSLPVAALLAAIAVGSLVEFL
jgi:hypothetical protein